MNHFQRPLPQQPEFEFCHRPLHAKKEAITREIGIVDSLGVHQNHFYQTTQSDQVMPVAAASCQPRSLDAKDGGDFAAAKFSHEASESAALEQHGPCAPQVFIDYRISRRPCSRAWSARPCAIRSAVDFGKLVRGMPESDFG